MIVREPITVADCTWLKMSSIVKKLNASILGIEMWHWPHIMNVKSIIERRTLIQYGFIAETSRILLLTRETEGGVSRCV
jgi:hypothetical protein